MSTGSGFGEEMVCIACPEPLGGGGGSICTKGEWCGGPSAHRCGFCPVEALPRRRRRHFTLSHSQDRGVRRALTTGGRGVPNIKPSKGSPTAALILLGVCAVRLKRCPKICSIRAPWVFSVKPAPTTATTPPQHTVISVGLSLEPHLPHPGRLPPPRPWSTSWGNNPICPSGPSTSDCSMEDPNVAERAPPDPIQTALGPQDRPRAVTGLNERRHVRVVGGTCTVSSVWNRWGRSGGGGLRWSLHPTLTSGRVPPFNPPGQGGVRWTTCAARALSRERSEQLALLSQYFALSAMLLPLLPGCPNGCAARAPCPLPCVHRT